uniref:Uncharacterized protein n=1 Tax=Rhizophora mucronata TaxID=61149 RepID=A0A2P2IR96_RHIMU
MLTSLQLVCFSREQTLCIIRQLILLAGSLNDAFATRTLNC